VYPLSSLNDLSPTSFSDMKDLYAIFAVEYVKNYGENFCQKKAVMYLVHLHFYTGNYLLLRSKV